MRTRGRIQVISSLATVLLATVASASDERASTYVPRPGVTHANAYVSPRACVTARGGGPQAVEPVRTQRSPSLAGPRWSDNQTRRPGAANYDHPQPKLTVTPEPGVPMSGDDFRGSARERPTVASTVRTPDNALTVHVAVVRVPSLRADEAMLPDGTVARLALSGPLHWGVSPNGARRHASRAGVAITDDEVRSLPGPTTLARPDHGLLGMALTNPTTLDGTSFLPTATDVTTPAIANVSAVGGGPRSNSR